MNHTEYDLLERCTSMNGAAPDTFEWHKDIGEAMVKDGLVRRRAGWFFVTAKGNRALNQARKDRKAFDIGPV